MSFGQLVFAFFLVLAPLILLHELGHFIVGKRAGIRVLEFGIGYPPRAVRLWRGKGSMLIGSRRVEIPRNFKLPKDLEDGKLVRAVADEIDGRLVLKSINVIEEDAGSTAPSEFGLDESQLYGEVAELNPGTEYTLNWLPLGGFVRFLGEEGITGKGSFVDAPKRWRTATLLAGPGMNVLVAVVVFTATFMLGWPSVPVTIKAVSPNSPAAEAGLQPNDVIVSVGHRPTRSLDQVQAYLNSNAGQPIGLTIQRGGQTLHISLTPRALDQTAQEQAAGVTLIDELPIVITGVSSDSPAAQAGLQPGDAILALDGESIRTVQQMLDYVQSHAGQSINLTVRRAGQRFNVTLTPRTDAEIPAGEGRMGIAFNATGYDLVQYPIGPAFNNTLDEVGNTLQQIVALPAKLLKGGAAAGGDAQIVGPVRISQFAGEALQASVETGQAFWFLNLFAAISLALAITNLLPLPALDGGRLIFVILEAIRRKRISPEREAMVHLIGMAFLLVLMVLVTIQDINAL